MYVPIWVLVTLAFFSFLFIVLLALILWEVWSERRDRKMVSQYAMEPWRSWEDLDDETEDCDEIFCCQSSDELIEEALAESRARAKSAEDALGSSVLSQHVQDMLDNGSPYGLMEPAWLQDMRTSVAVFDGPDTPPLPEEDVVRYLAVDESITEPKGITMTTNTATVASVVAAVRKAAKRLNVSDTDLNAVLAEAGVGSKENHTVTITVTGDSFAEVRDRAVRVIGTYGPTATERTFPATSDGVHFEHTKTVSFDV